jgi:MFS family permease
MSYFSENFDNDYQDIFLPPPDDLTKHNSKPISKWSDFVHRNQGVITVTILFALFTCNQTDRYVVGAVLIEVQDYFQIDKSTAGLLQTILLLSSMAASPLFGYLGDRYNRQYLLVVSVLLWTASVLAGSFCDRDQFALFCVSRALFGVASASFETVAVHILGFVFFQNLINDKAELNYKLKIKNKFKGDCFADQEVVRNRALVTYFMAPPIGTGLSYIISVVSKDLVSPNDWRYVMRVTSFILIPVLVALLTVYVEPEKKKQLDEFQAVKKRKYLADVGLLMRNKTYIMLTLAWVCGLSSLGTHFD